VANSDAIKKLNSELARVQDETKVVRKKVVEKKDVEKKAVEKKVVEKEVAEKKVCRYFNRGYCKYKLQCRFVHSQKICEEHLKYGKCGDNSCSDRHPKECKWLGQVLDAEEIPIASIFMLLLLVMMINATNVKDAKVCLKKKNM
jgi:hypothetical protein